MAASPRYKVFSESGEYVAACKHAEDAAAIVACYGPGASIRLGHSKAATLYTEQDDCLAAESVDAVAQRCHVRESELLEASMRASGRCPSSVQGGATQ